MPRWVVATAGDEEDAYAERERRAVSLAVATARAVWEAERAKLERALESADAASAQRCAAIEAELADTRRSLQDAQRAIDAARASGAAQARATARRDARREAMAEARQMLESSLEEALQGERRAAREARDAAVADVRREAALERAAAVEAAQLEVQRALEDSRRAQSAAVADVCETAADEARLQLATPAKDHSGAGGAIARRKSSANKENRPSLGGRKDISKARRRPAVTNETATSSVRKSRTVDGLVQGHLENGVQVTIEW